MEFKDKLVHANWLKLPVVRLEDKEMKSISFIYSFFMVQVDVYHHMYVGISDKYDDEFCCNLKVFTSHD